MSDHPVTPPRPRQQPRLEVWKSPEQDALKNKLVKGGTMLDFNKIVLSR